MVQVRVRVMVSRVCRILVSRVRARRVRVLFRVRAWFRSCRDRVRVVVSWG